jgi:hypothetical protein
MHYKNDERMIQMTEIPSNLKILDGSADYYDALEKKT